MFNLNEFVFYPGYGEKETAEIIALACSSPPHGRKRWSVRLIVEEMKKKKGFEGINRESVRLILKKRHKTMEEKNVVQPDHRRGIHEKNVRCH